ncbi:MAG TPA: glycosyltransferase family 4 protein [Candidatus Bathyarchaeia archaeon]|nr:glycosyltransferase family 4 protein [Candidatus Bathyarchaeia archaeon]
MKLAMIEEDLSVRSGSRRFIYEATKILEAQGHNVRVFALKMDTKICFPQMLQTPVEVVPTEDFSFARSVNLALGKNVDYYLARTLAVMEISRRTAEWSPDVVVFHYTGELWLPPYFYHLKKPVGVVCLHVLPRGVAPFHVNTLREKIDQKVIELSPIGIWSNRSLKKLGMILAHSRFVYDQAIRMKSSKAGPEFGIVPLGVNHSEFYPTFEEEPFVLCVARIHPQKKLELAVQAMKDANPNFSLVFAGDVEPRFAWYKENLVSLAEKLHLGNRFRIEPAPTPERLVSLLQKCAVFVFPSTKDTFGLSVLEAMACGKPIIASRAGGVPEVVGDCGFLVDPVAEHWRKALQKLLSDRNLREQMGKKACKRSKLYSWDATVSSLMQAIKSCLSD